jgi:hypothetical protein
MPAAAAGVAAAGCADLDTPRRLRESRFTSIRHRLPFAAACRVSGRCRHRG